MNSKLFLMMFVVVLLIGQVSAFEFDNIKRDVTFDRDSTIMIGDKEISYREIWERYAPLKINNAFGLGETLWEGAIDEHTESCGTNCLSTIDINLANDGSLIDDIEFYTIKEDESRIKQDIKNYKLYIKTGEIENIIQDYEWQCIDTGRNYKNGSQENSCSSVNTGSHVEIEYIWDEYNIGDLVRAGNYKVKLEGEKKLTRTVDWVIKTNGRWINSWAVWGLTTFTVDNNGLTFGGATGVTNRRGATFVMNTPAHLENATQASGSTATLCYLYEFPAYTLLNSSTYVGDTCPISFDLVEGIEYTIQNDAGGGTYDRVFVNTGSLPIAGTNLNWTGEAEGSTRFTTGVQEIQTITTSVSTGEIILNSPEDNSASFSTTVEFDCSATQVVDIVNMSLVTNQSGIFEIVNTTSVSGLSNQTTWDHDLESLGQYLWTCQACDTDGDCGFGENRTISIVVPNITLNSPADDFVTLVFDNEFNISANLLNASFIKNMSLYTNKSGVFEVEANFTFAASGLAFSNSTEVVSTATSFALVKNISYNNYANNVTNEIGTNSAISHTLSSITRYVYEDSPSLDINFTTVSSTASFTFVEYPNPRPNKKISNIEIYLKTSSGSNDVREKNTQIFGQPVTEATEIFNTTITEATLWTGQVCTIDDECFFSSENRTILVDQVAPVINLSSPSGAIESIVIGDNLSLNWSVSDTNLDSCWFDYNDINTTVTCTDNNFSFITIQDEQSIIFYANDTVNNLGSNTTSWTYNFIENNVTFNDIVFETSNQNFVLNLTTQETILSISGVMNYDNVDYLSIILCDNGDCIMENNIDIPLVDSGPSDTNNFFWNFTIFNGTSSNNIQTSTRQQIVNQTFLEICNGTHTVETLNFTAFDEINLTQLDSFDFAATFDFWIGGGTVMRNNTFSESGVEVNLCMKDDLNYSTTATIDYDESGNTSTYVSRFYYFDNHSINSTRQDIPLFLLQSAFSTSFILKVQDENLLPVEGALITTQRCYADEIDCRTVQIALTDENGKSIGFFQTETVDYKFIITKNGEILLETGKQKVVPETSPFTLTFNTGDDLGEPWAGQNEIPNLNSTLVFNKDTGIVTYVYIDTSSNFTSATLNVTRNSLSNSSATISVCNEVSTLASSTIFCDVGNTTGFYTATGFITRSGTGLDKQIAFQIENISSIVGLLGLFFGWFLILVSMFMFKFNEIAGIWITTIVIALINLTGLIKFGGVFVTSIIVLAIIITWLLER